MKSTMTRFILLSLAPTLMSCAGPKQTNQAERPVLASVKTVAVSTSAVPDFYRNSGNHSFEDHDGDFRQNDGSRHPHSCV